MHVYTHSHTHTHSWWRQPQVRSSWVGSPSLYCSSFCLCQSKLSENLTLPSSLDLNPLLLGKIQTPFISLPITLKAESLQCLSLYVFLPLGLCTAPALRQECLHTPSPTLVPLLTGNMSLSFWTRLAGHLSDRLQRRGICPSALNSPLLSPGMWFLCLCGQHPGA